MACLIIILDGCNEHYINSESTPFLFQMKKKGSYISMQVTPSFATRTELFTGKSPSITDTFVDFCYDSKRFPFKRLKPIIKSNDFTSNKKRKHKYLTLAHYFLSGIWVDFGYIPRSILSHLSISGGYITFKREEKRRSKNHLFGVLHENGYEVDFIYGSTQKISNKMENRKVKENEVIILHFGKLDHIGHEHGPNSPHITTVISEIDSKIKEIYKNLEDSLELTMIFGDHNMVQVDKQIDLWTELIKLDIKPIQDYLFFLNSPMARFWFNNKKAEDKIYEFLSKFKNYGKIIDKNQLKKYNLPEDDKYGELIFWCNKGVSITPDFYHLSKIKGLHGYIDDPGTTPLIIIPKDKKINLEKEANLRDVMPTLLDLLGIDYSGIQGNSLIINGGQ